MKINRITFTGADDTADPQELLQLSRSCPSVEWAILFSPKKQGSNRYPSERWLENFFNTIEKMNFRPDLSAHLCGEYAFGLSEGKNTWVEKFPQYEHYFQRVQINTGPNFSLPAHCKMMDYMFALKALTTSRKQIIIQSNGINYSHLVFLQINGFDVVGLSDQSGGKGKEISSYEYPDFVDYWGFAGGIGPENVETVLENIQKATEPKEAIFWIDMETKLRDAEDKFSLDYCEKVISQTLKYIID